MISVTKGSLTARAGVKYTLRGATRPGVRLRVNGTLAELDARGRFAIPVPFGAYADCRAHRP